MNHLGTKAHGEAIPIPTDGVAAKIVDAAYSVHTRLGPGLVESIYEVCLCRELQKRDLKLHSHRLGLLINFNTTLIRQGIHRSAM